MKTGIKGFDDSTPDFAKSTVRPMDRADPGVFTTVLVDDLAGLILRPVVNQNKFDRTNCLTDDALDHKLQIRFLVPNWRDDRVFCVEAHSYSHAVCKTTGKSAHAYRVAVNRDLGLHRNRPQGRRAHGANHS